MISREDYELLKPIESEFSRVLDSQYKLPTSREQDEMVLSIVRKYEPKYGYHDFGCPQCAFNLYATAGRLYRSCVPEPVKQEVVEEKKSEESKPKTPRKKKEDK